MNEENSIPYERPSLIGSFFRGALSSAFSGALMAGIVALVGPFFGVPATLVGALFLFTATGMFGGVMAVKRAVFDTPHPGAYEAPAQSYVPVPAIAGPAVGADLANEPEQPSKSWVAETSRNGDAQSRIQQILANGALNDKDRASAILAAREAAASADTARSA